MDADSIFSLGRVLAVCGFCLMVFAAIIKGAAQ